MKKLTFRIQGEFQHSFIYSGVLFLIDFNKKLSAYKWEDLLSNSISKLDKESQSVYLNLFSKKESIVLTDDFGKIGELDIVSEEVLRKYQFDDQININDYPTEIDIKCNVLFYSSERGLLKIPFSWIKKDKYSPNINFPTKSAELLFGDCKVFNFSQSYSDRILLCMGKNGLSDSKYETFDKDKLKINYTDTSKIWLDSQYFNDIENNHFALLSDGISVQCIADDETSTYVKKLNRLNKIKGERKKSGKSIECIESLITTVQKNFIESNFSIIQNLENNSEGLHSQESIEIYTKERRVNRLNANFIQLGDSLFYQNSIESNHKLELADNFVNWRVFPNATNHFNHCHVIYDDYIEIIGFDKTDCK